MTSSIGVGRNATFLNLPATDETHQFDGLAHTTVIREKDWNRQRINAKSRRATCQQRVANERDERKHRGPIEPSKVAAVARRRADYDVTNKQTIKARTIIEL